MNLPITVKDIPSSIFISVYANHLKRSRQITIPSWLDIIKTGSSRTSTPLDPDWFFYKLASLARKFYFKNTFGIARLKKKVSKKKNTKTSPPKKKSGSGRIIRLALNELGKLNIIKINSLGERSLTKRARQDMDIRSIRMYKSLNKK